MRKADWQIQRLVLLIYPASDKIIISELIYNIHSEKSRGKVSVQGDIAVFRPLLDRIRIISYVRIVVYGIMFIPLWGSWYNQFNFLAVSEGKAMDRRTFLQIAGKSSLALMLSSQI